MMHVEEGLQWFFLSLPCHQIEKDPHDVKTIKSSRQNNAIRISAVIFPLLFFPAADNLFFYPIGIVMGITRMQLWLLVMLKNAIPCSVYDSLLDIELATIFLLVLFSFLFIEGVRVMWHCVPIKKRGIKRGLVYWCRHQHTICFIAATFFDITKIRFSPRSEFE